MADPQPKTKGPTPEFWDWLQLLAIFAVALAPTWLLIVLALCACGLPLWLFRSPD